MSIFSKFSQTSCYNEEYFKCIKKAQNFQEYIENEKQIACITNILVERADVPYEIVALLIESVQENVAIEYESLKSKSNVNL